MNLTQLIQHLRTSQYFQARITAWHDIPARAAQTAPFPDWLQPELVAALKG